LKTAGIPTEKDALFVNIVNTLKYGFKRRN
jgi:hypothetical protein